MYTAIWTRTVEAAVDLGMDVYKIAKAGWKLTKANFGPDESFGQCSAKHPCSPLLSGQLELHGTERGGEHLSDQLVSWGGWWLTCSGGASCRTGQSHQTCPGSAEEGGGSLRLASLCLSSHHGLGLWGILAAANLSTQQTCWFPEDSPGGPEQVEVSAQEASKSGHSPRRNGAHLWQRPQPWEGQPHDPDRLGGGPRPPCPALVCQNRIQPAAETCSNQETSLS